MTWPREVEATLGRRAAAAAVALVLLGAGAFATGLGGGRAPRTFAALIASWLFFAGMAAGAVAFRALFQVLDAGWARPLADLGRAPASFFPAASVLLVVILAGARAAPWVAEPGRWLHTPVLAARELLLNALLFGLAALGLRRRGEERPGTRPWAVAYCIVYGVVLSVWAFDFVLGPDPAWSSTLIGPYVFVGAFLTGTGAVVLAGLARGALSEDQRIDAGALLLALAVFWGYLFWSQYLTIWYGNLPEEIGFALRRSVDGWGGVVLAVVALVFALPFLGFLHPRGRRSSRLVAALLVLQLVGLWLNCHLLVVPSLATRGSAPIGARDLLIALGMLGAFALSVGPRLSRPGGLARPGWGGAAGLAFVTLVAGSRAFAAEPGPPAQPVPAAAIRGPSWLRALALPVDMTSMGHMGGGGAPPRFPGAEAFAAAVRRAAELAGTDDAAARRSLEATFPIDGAAVYRMNCRPCHGPRGAGKPPEIASILSHSRALSPSVQEDAMRRAGAQPSPDLARQLAEHADLTLRRRLKEGGAKASPPYLAEMPPFRHLSEAEIGALGDYLRRLAGVPAGSRPARAVESALRMGEHVARGTCLICHDGTGPGAGHSLLMAGRIPSLAVIPDHLSLEAVVHKTRHGWIEMSGIIHQKSRMPVFSYLSDEEVAAAYLYLLYLPPRE